VGGPCAYSEKLVMTAARPAEHKLIFALGTGRILFQSVLISVFYRWVTIGITATTGRRTPALGDQGP
jgi:hypothetical protein